MHILFFSFAAWLCSIFSGMFGVAGGIVLLAILFAADYPNNVAIPLHGAIMLISYASVLSLYFRQIHLSAFFMFVLGSLPAVLSLGSLVSHVDRHLVQITLSAILIYVTWAPERAKLKNPFKSVHSSMFAAGLLGGALAILIGAVGVFLAPLFLREEWDKKVLLATQAMCMAYIQILKISTYSFLGFHVFEHLELLVPMGICVILGNMVGLYFAGKLSTQNYRLLYKSVLTLAVLLLLTDIVLDRYAAPTQ